MNSVCLGSSISNSVCVLTRGANVQPDTVFCRFAFQIRFIRWERKQLPAKLQSCSIFKKIKEAEFVTFVLVYAIKHTSFSDVLREHFWHWT